MVGEIPHFASVLSYQMADQRSQTDSFPTAIEQGYRYVKNGFLDIEHLALMLGYNGRIEDSNHWWWDPQNRMGTLDALRNQSQFGDARDMYASLQGQSRQLMDDPDLNGLFDIIAARYGDNYSFERQCDQAIEFFCRQQRNQNCEFGATRLGSS